MAEWISVKDRLPPENKRVLTYDPFYEDAIFISQYANEFFVESFGVNWIHQVYGEKCTVTHWAELPEPPNGWMD